MRKLYELKATVDGLAKIVTTPDADLDVTVTSSLSPQSFSSTVLTSPTDLDTVLGKVRIWYCDFLHHTHQIAASPSSTGLTRTTCLVHVISL